MQPVADDAA